MNKAEEIMTDDEKMNLRIFLEKEKELLEKKEDQRKKWEKELQKLKAEIQDLKSKFDDKMSNLIKKKLFVQMRIFEQELYIIRVTLSIFENEERVEKKK